MDNFSGFCRKKHWKGNGTPRIKSGGKTFPALRFADDLSILDESVSKVNELLGGFASSGS